MTPLKGSALDRVVRAARSRAHAENPLAGFELGFSRDLINAFMEELRSEVLDSGKPLRVPGFGTFRVARRKARAVKWKGERYEIPETRTLAFKAAKERKCR